MSHLAFPKAAETVFLAESLHNVWGLPDRSFGFPFRWFNKGALPKAEKCVGVKMLPRSWYFFFFNIWGWNERKKSLWCLTLIIHIPEGDIVLVKKAYRVHTFCGLHTHAACSLTLRCSPVRWHRQWISTVLKNLQWGLSYNLNLS